MSFILSKTDCAIDEFKCYDGMCIPRTSLCDNSTDCRWGEDEQKYHCPCEPDQYKCPYDGTCINNSSFCDSVRDCMGGEDESVNTCGRK